MLRIFAGETGQGLSGVLVNRMIKESMNAPSDTFIAVVPEQATLMMQKRAVMAHPANVVMNIDVTSFERLAKKVFEELGQDTAKLLNDTGKVLVLRHVLERTGNDLDVYSKKVRMPGFAGAIKSVLSELAQYDIDDNTLFLMQEHARKKNNDLLKRKLQDIRLIRNAFYEDLSGKYSTSEEVLKTLAHLVQKSEILKGAHIYMDGFTGFTQVQYGLIAQLMKSAADINVSLVIPGAFEKQQKKPENMFYLSNRTYHRLISIARNSGSEYQTVREERGGNAGKERITPGKTFCLCAGDIAEEVRFIARSILHSVRKDGRRFRDHAIICSDMESYYRVFRNEFAKAGIPCFIDYKQELGDNALARYIMSALSVAVNRFSYESMFAFLKCGMSELSGEEICKLENYCLEFGIRGYTAWSQVFTKNRKMRSSEQYFWDLKSINALREKAVRSLKDFYQKCTGDKKRTDEYCSALKELLEADRAEDKLKKLSDSLRDSDEPERAKQYEMIYGAVTLLLDQISELTGSEVQDLSGFADFMKGAMGDMKVSIIPPVLDQVVVGDLIRTRIEDVPVLFMCGMNDGKIPSEGSLQGLLTQRERQILSESEFELAPASVENLYTQYFYIWMMMSKPSHALYLTCAQLDMQGEEMKPSCVFEYPQEFGAQNCEILFPGRTDRSEENKEDPENSLPELWNSVAAGMLSEEIRKYAAAFQDDPETAQLSETGKRLLQYYGLNSKDTFLKILDGAFFENRALPIDERTVIDLYGEKLTGSVSRYETFFMCPFRHFLDYGLRIEKRPEYEVRATDIGTIYHDGLEQYSRALKNLGLSFRNVEDEQSRQIAKQCITEAASKADSDILTSSKRNEYMLERMTQVMIKTTDVLRMHVKQGLYEPEEFEWSFVDGTHSAAFKGKIDRVDIYDGTDVYVKIIDYKSGNKKFSIRDIYTGQSLQLVAYLSEAVKEERKKRPGRTVKAGGVYYYPVHDRFVRDKKEELEKFRMSGLTSAEPEALKAIDTTLSTGTSSRVVQISYSGRGLSAKSHAVSDMEFENLMAYTDRKINEAGERIRSGEASISPAYENSAKNACVYCEYKNICKFEPGKWGSDYSTLPDKTDTAEMEKEIYGRH